MLGLTGKISEQMVQGWVAKPIEQNDIKVAMAIIEIHPPTKCSGYLFNYLTFKCAWVLLETIDGDSECQSAR